jgi:hypothetical protein
LDALQEENRGKELADFANLIDAHRADLFDRTGHAFSLQSSKTFSGGAAKKANEVWTDEVRDIRRGKLDTKTTPGTYVVDMTFISVVTESRASGLCLNRSTRAGRYLAATSLKI